METRPTYQVYAEYKKPGYCQTHGELIAVIASGLFAIVVLAITGFLFFKFTSEFLAVTMAGAFIGGGVMFYRRYSKTIMGKLFSGFLFCLLVANAVNVLRGVL